MTTTIPVRVSVPGRGGVTTPVEVDVGHLKRRLEETVSGEVRFDAGTKALYATDASNFRQVPIGVVIPRTVDDVVATHRACHEFGAPILGRGCGTSLSGETVNYAVVVDFSKYLDRIEEPDGAAGTVVCQPGAINEHVNERTGPAIDMVFGPDPSTHAYCTIGGNIGNNSCGVHSVQSQLYGRGPRTSDNVSELEVVTYDGERFIVGVDEEERLDEIIAAGGRKGEIYAALRELRDRYGDEIRRVYRPASELPRRVSGYNLDELLPERGFNVARALCGTEGTCVNVVSARLLLTPALLHRALVIIEYDDLVEACDEVSELIEQWRPIGLEGLDKRLIENEIHLGLHPEEVEELPKVGGEAWLLVQLGGEDAEETDQRAGELCRWLEEERGIGRERVKILASDQDGGHSSDIWKVREGGLGATAFPPDSSGDHWPGWEDSAVPPERIGPYVRDLRALYEKHGYKGAIYGHFGQGCIHSRINFDLRSAGGLATYRAFMEEASDLVVSYGGSLSGEHGDGQQRAELLVKQYGPELIEAMREFKRIWDPDWRMNPGKVAYAYRFDENLKLGADYNPRRSEVRFAYGEDSGDFAHATVRCVGVGRCRIPDAEEVMCPSFQVTREEQHSTRGRTRLLFEMLQGEVITDGWQSKEVFEALDLCLACKGCTNDCPVNVDMPTYKAEFLHHHYRSLRRWRPRYAYAFGLIDQAARVASLMPGLVNFATRTPGISRLAKLAAGLAPERDIPAFAPVTLQRWFAERGGTANPDGPRVVLWPDTFNNHFHTDVGVAAVEALEAAGWQVAVPAGHVCCGRPLYDYGFLDLAQRYLERTLDVLRDDVRAGVPVVGIEPSCLAVFKDELTKMLHHDDDARRLAEQSFHFGQFFAEHDIEVPRLERDALLWGHCHHKATGGMEGEEQVLARMGVDVEQVTGGCCGLAGSWGFEAGKHDLSLRAGDQALLPAVRKADERTIVVANGFSCKTQIEQGDTGRRALHLAQVMKMGRERGAAGVQDGPPEAPYYAARPSAPVALRARRAAAAAGAALAAAGVALRAARA